VFLDKSTAGELIYCSLKQVIVPIPPAEEIKGGLAYKFSDIEQQSNLRGSHWKKHTRSTQINDYSRIYSTGTKHTQAEKHQMHLQAHRSMCIGI